MEKVAFDSKESPNSRGACLQSKGRTEDLSIQGVGYKFHCCLLFCGDQQLVSETGHLRKLHCKMEKRALSQLSPLITTDSYEFSDCLVFSRSGELMNFHIISKGLFVIYTLVGLLGS